MTSALRSELYGSHDPGPTEADFIKSLHASLKSRKALIAGAVDKGKQHCAIGCYFADNPNTAVKNSLVDQVAAVNDAVPQELGNKVRMQIVRKWVENRAKALGVTL